MTEQKPTTQRDMDPDGKKGLGKSQEGHFPASESDRSTPTDEQDTHLPASESDDLKSSDAEERIIQRGLTRLPPG
ncbi:hypothetical protein GRI75_08795 [Altererythrobacter soli]|uniref:Uncharacterized protein n=1 Tax=Croceibacterium soli TaxID=1739690 RepID=A0A6I4UVD8_9SPHN|nr:hypothetical protein [Croceibacterium soli]MXP41739.1 hypothetical protein [Croceibacterium soli]